MAILKEKLRIDQQILHMKEKGITFKIKNEEDAKDFLENSNYYFKIKSFTKNYTKDKQGKYINLDFAHLREFSILDTLLRDLILELSLGCEHFLKTKLHAHFCNNDKEDGYNIVNQYLICLKMNKKKPPKSLSLYKYYQKNSSGISKGMPFTAKLIEKYNDEGKIPLWVFIEILSFSELIDFVKSYCRIYPDLKLAMPFAFSVKKLRNAAAHNSCILHHLIVSPLKPSRTHNLFHKIRELNLFSEKYIKNKLDNLLIHDFLCLLFFYNEMASEKSKLKGAQAIKSFFKRCDKHKKFFLKHQAITSRYFFVKKIFNKVFLNI